jgi:hypothetical protein
MLATLQPREDLHPGGLGLALGAVAAVELALSLAGERIPIEFDLDRPAAAALEDRAFHRAVTAESCPQTAWESALGDVRVSGR